MVLAQEWQFDGLVGPTHNYAGLAVGNFAAKANAGAVSNPRAAALQGLQKMRFVRDLGMPQAFIPPHFRPIVPELKRFGFGGNGGLQDLLSHTAAHTPWLLATVYSASNMWTANAATVTPSADSADGKVHFTPANMASHYHRALEAEFTRHLLQKIFHNPNHFCIHNFLFHHASLGDEGAANHMVVCRNHGLSGQHIFVVGDEKISGKTHAKFPARQRLVASTAIARNHQITTEPLFLQQSPEAIDHGVFHNDVIAMNTTRTMIVHAQAFVPEDQARLQQAMAAMENVRYREITDTELPLSDAVSSYLFNSQLLDIHGKTILIAPQEAHDNSAANRVIHSLREEGVLDAVHHLDLRESMRNGGGPACLRLRVVMTPEQAAAIHPGVILTDSKYNALEQWINTHYRDRLTAQDLADPALVGEMVRAYTALESILEMPGLYAEAIAAALD